MSSRVSDARSEKRPLSSTSEPVNNDLETNSKQSNTVTVITSFDAAKIRKDAETAIEKDNKISMQKAETSVFYSNAERAVEGIKQEKESVMEGQPMFFRTEEGEVYGFTMDGKIYIDPKVATSETPIHEYSHLWAQALRKANPQAWEQLKSEMMKDQELVDYVRRKYPEIENEDELAEEVFAHYSGRRGAERLRTEMREEMDKAARMHREIV